MKVTMACYMSGDADTFVDEARPIVQKLVELTGDNKFLAGEDVSYLDFVWFETLECINFVGNNTFNAEFPSLVAYADRVKELPKFSEFWLDDEKCIKRPFNNTSAKINN